jgi:hypothetical protein
MSVGILRLNQGEIKLWPLRESLPRFKINLMRKLAFLLIATCTLVSCSESGILTVDLSEEDENYFYLKPKHALTSKCRLQIQGNVDCPFTVAISGENSLKFEPGRIGVDCTYEWYEEGRAIRVYADSSCSSGNIINIRYRFSTGYFGQKKKCVDSHF